MPFGEIAELLDRSPDAARQLASRARREVHVSAPPPEPNLAAQRVAVDAYFAVPCDGGLASSRSSIRRWYCAPTAATARRWCSTAPSRSAAGHCGGPPRRRVQPALVNGSAGVVAYQDGAPFAVLAFTVRDSRITAIDIFNDPELVPRLLS